MKRFITAFFLLLILVNSAVPANALTLGTASDPPDVQSETAVLMDADTGQVLYQKDMDKQMYPASITKIMTGMLALKYGNLTDMITVSDEAVKSVDIDSANIALNPGEQLTLEQALYAISIASANDAANGIAEAIGGSIGDFVAMMNTAAEEAGATNTHFNNANGLPDDSHYTSAHDMALITAEALKTPGFTEIFGAKRYKIPPTNKQPEERIVNSSNRFLNGELNYDGTLISKAGWTLDAKHTLVTAAQRNGTTLVAVVMKADDSTVKWSDTVALFDYGFDQFSRVTVTKEDIVKTAPAALAVPGDTKNVIDPNTYEAQDVSLLLPADQRTEEIQVTYGEPRLGSGANQAEIPVQLSLPAAASQGGAVVLLETTVKAGLQPAAPVAVAESPAPAVHKTSVFTVILIVLASAVGLLALAFAVLVIRRAIIIRKRKRRRLQKLQQPNPQRRRPRTKR